MNARQAWSGQFAHIYVPERGVDEYECYICHNIGSTPASLHHTETCPVGALTAMLIFVKACKRFHGPGSSCEQVRRRRQTVCEICDGLAALEVGA